MRVSIMSIGWLLWTKLLPIHDLQRRWGIAGSGQWLMTSTPWCYSLDRWDLFMLSTCLIMKTFAYDVHNSPFEMWKFLKYQNVACILLGPVVPQAKRYWFHFLEGCETNCLIELFILCWHLLSYWLLNGTVNCMVMPLEVVRTLYF
jgi:hypothetical protein